MEPTTTAAGMTLTAKIIAGIIGLAVAGGVTYTVVNKNPNPESEEHVIAETTASSSAEASFSGNILGLLKRTGNWECTWSATSNGAEMSGVVWVSNGKFKSTTDVSVGGKAVIATVVSDGEYVYSWMEGMPNGMKFHMKEAEAAAETNDAHTMGSVFAQSYNYACDPWNPKNETFAIPAGITFADLSDMQAKMHNLNEIDLKNVDINAMLQQR